jgi:5'-nucleotidase / UDP-sugar diphosphatase
MLGQGALSTALPASLLADEGDVITISLLHTTDLHGHILPTVDYDDHPDLGGLARCATQIRQWQRANPNSILLDIGDVYQGTEVGLRTQGATMIRCLNALAYDAWVVGNHEFDWGLDAFTDSVKLSTMPVLSGNALIGGRAVGTLPDSAGPLSRLRPWLVKEIAGFRIVVIGLTTPALSTWLPPENLGNFESLDPVEALHGILLQAKELKPDAIVLAGHMGLTRRDDYANRVGALTREFPQLTAFLGGHTHQNHSGEVVNNVLYSQADHYGIYAGKLDLTFDRATRKLVRREAVTLHMDKSVPLDPLVLSIARADLDAADAVLARAIGELADPLSVTSAVGRPSDIERLIGSAMKAALSKQNCEVDAVVHGLFDNKHAQMPGIKSVADAWAMLPYENEIVTVDLAHDDLLALARDFSSGSEHRSIMGVGLAGSSDAGGFRVEELRASDGTPLPEKPAYRIALNSYDSQSGGQRFVTAGKLIARPSSRRVLHQIQIRNALIDFFVDRGKVTRASLLV